MDQQHSSPVAQHSKLRPLQVAIDLIRGFIIGAVELVPGVSGGTAALVLGIYERLVSSASHVVSAALSAVFSPPRRVNVMEQLKLIDWRLLIPLLIGMPIAIFSMSGVLHSFVENQQVLSRSLFMGMVLASLTVPVTMLRDAGPITSARRNAEISIAVAVAIGVFFLLGVPTLDIVTPAPWVIVLSGALAICALALPGLSGSFVLLTFGMYAPTLEAASTVNIGYLSLFAFGALVGLSSFVKVLNHLLHTHRRMTLVVMTGVMAGALRALWPWQTESGALEAVGPDWIAAFGLFAVGACAVLGLWIAGLRRDAI